MSEARENSSQEGKQASDIQKSGTGSTSKAPEVASENGTPTFVLPNLTGSQMQSGMMARMVSLALVLLMIVILGMMFFRVVYPFLMSIFLAGVLTVLCQPMQRHFTKRFKGSSTWGAMASTAIIMLSISLPTIIGVTLGTLELYQIAVSGLDGSRVGELIKTLSRRFDPVTIAEELEKIWPTKVEGMELTRIRPEFTWDTATQFQDYSADEQITEQGIKKSNLIKSTKVITFETLVDEGTIHERQIKARIEDLRKSLQTALINIAQATLTPGTALTTLNVLSGVTSVLMSSVIFVIALYYFLADGSQLQENVQSLIPVNVDHQRKVFHQFATAVRAVVMSTMLAAGAQGVATSAAIWLLGFGNFFILTIVSTLSALVPIAGTWLVWLPCTLWLIAQGDVFSASMLAVWGFFVVGTLDNIIRAYILQSDAKLHPLLAFISVLGGIQAMGLWGVFIAPIIASCLHALIEIFNSELKEISKSQVRRVEPEVGNEENSLPLTAKPEPKAG